MTFRPLRPRATRHRISLAMTPAQFSRVAAAARCTGGNQSVIIEDRIAACLGDESFRRAASPRYAAGLPPTGRRPTPAKYVTKVTGPSYSRKMTLRLDLELFARLDAEARMLGLDKADVIRAAIDYTP